MKRSRWAPWLALLAVRIGGELLFGLAQWGWFLARRRVLKEEMAMTLIGRKRARRLRNLRAAAIAGALALVAAGCATSAVTASPATPTWKRVVTFDKFTDSLSSIFVPVYGTQSPWLLLEETVFEFRPDSGTQMLVPVVEAMRP